ncbi:hypothetical protein [Roseibium algae]|uniref:Uncharacterized protein n=1 Tax=Roseibium algae TaxID=3123038 RepID=A0ABU8TIQ6_9HYPH
MAKGQVRSNREKRKPKKDKAAVKVTTAAPFSSQIEAINKRDAAPGKTKG